MTRRFRRVGPEALASLTAVAFALAGGPGFAETSSFDLLLVNGRVYTGDASRPWAEAVGVADERIVAVGGSAELRRRAGPRTRAS